MALHETFMLCCGQEPDQQDVRVLKNLNCVSEYLLFYLFTTTGTMWAEMGVTCYKSDALYNNTTIESN